MNRERTRAQWQEKIREIQFPRDEGRHVDAGYEWWYLNAHLTSSSGHRMGLLVNFVRGELLIMLADLEERKMVHRAILKQPGLRATPSRLEVSFGPCWWRAKEGRESEYEIHCEYRDFEAALTMKSTKVPLLVNRKGLIPEGLLGYSYYYAQTRMEISGELRLGRGRTLRVSGLGWVDRQWGNWEWSGLGKWTWFSLQLSNGEEFIGFQVLHPLTDGIVLACLNELDSGGDARVLKAFRLERLNEWKSPKTGSTYATKWGLSADGRVFLTIEADFEDQELIKGFWEGSSEVSGRIDDQEVSGVAYVEQADPLVAIRRVKRFSYLYLGALNKLLSQAYLGRGPSLWKFLRLG